MCRQLHHLGENLLLLVRRLGAGPDGDGPADRVLRRQHAAAFHGMRAATMLEQRFAEDVRPIAEGLVDPPVRSEEHTSELQSLMRTPYAAFFSNTKNTCRPPPDNTQ